MPKIQLWAKFPEALRRHLIERMSDRSITLTDLNQLRLEQILKFPWETGTKISDRSSCAEKGHIRKLSFCPGSQRAEPSCRRFVSLLPFPAGRIEPHHEDSARRQVPPTARDFEVFLTLLRAHEMLTEIRKQAVKPNINSHETL